MGDAPANSGNGAALTMEYLRVALGQSECLLDNLEETRAIAQRHISAYERAALTDGLDAELVRDSITMLFTSLEESRKAVEQELEPCLAFLPRESNDDEITGTEAFLNSVGMDLTLGELEGAMSTFASAREKVYKTQQEVETTLLALKRKRNELKSQISFLKHQLAEAKRVGDKKVSLDVKEYLAAQVQDTRIKRKQSKKLIPVKSKSSPVVKDERPIIGTQTPPEWIDYNQPTKRKRAKRYDDGISIPSQLAVLSESDELKHVHQAEEIKQQTDEIQSLKTELEKERGTTALMARSLNELQIQCTVLSDTKQQEIDGHLVTIKTMEEQNSALKLANDKLAEEKRDLENKIKAILSIRTAARSVRESLQPVAPVPAPKVEVTDVETDTEDLMITRNKYTNTMDVFRPQRIETCDEFTNTINKQEDDNIIMTSDIALDPPEILVTDAIAQTDTETPIQITDESVQIEDTTTSEDHKDIISHDLSDPQDWLLAFLSSINDYIKQLIAKSRGETQTSESQTVFPQPIPSLRGEPVVTQLQQTIRGLKSLNNTITKHSPNKRIAELQELNTKLGDLTKELHKRTGEVKEREKTITKLKGEDNKKESLILQLQSETRIRAQESAELKARMSTVLEPKASTFADLIKGKTSSLGLFDINRSMLLSRMTKVNAADTEIDWSDLVDLISICTRKPQKANTRRSILSRTMEPIAESFEEERYSFKNLEELVHKVGLDVKSVDKALIPLLMLRQRLLENEKRQVPVQPNFMGHSSLGIKKGQSLNLDSKLISLGEAEQVAPKEPATEAPTLGAMDTWHKRNKRPRQKDLALEQAPAGKSGPVRVAPLHVTKVDALPPLPEIEHN